MKAAPTASLQSSLTEARALTERLEAWKQAHPPAAATSREPEPEPEPQLQPAENATPARSVRGEEGVAQGGDEGVAFVERDPYPGAPPERAPQRTGSSGGSRAPARPPPRRRAAVVEASSQHVHSRQQQAEDAQRLATLAGQAEQHAVVERLHRHRRARSKPQPSEPPGTPRRADSAASAVPPATPTREGQPPTAPSVPPSPVGIGRVSVLPSLFLVDWDDTILPTSLLSTMIPLNDLARAGSRDATRAVATAAVHGRLPPGFAAQLQRLETVALRSLERIVRAVGWKSLVLVTNAAHGWVDATASLLLPNIYAQLLRPESGESVRVVYARPASVARPSQCTEGAQTAWKLAAFAQEVASARANSVAVGTGPRLNLVSMGDSNYERMAMKRAATRRAAEGGRRSDNASNAMASPVANAESPSPLDRFWFESDSTDVVKTVKFRELPEAVQLRKEWERVWELLPELCEGTDSEDTVLRP